MDAPKTLTRQDAFRSGQRTFFTGRACKNGHISNRYVSNGACVACQSAFGTSAQPLATQTVLIPPMRVHPDDAAQIYAAVDYLNAQRGLPPCPRPETHLTVPSEFEQYVIKEMKRPVSERRPLDYLESSAVARGYVVAYETIPRPVDTWSRPLMLPEHVKNRVRIEGPTVTMPGPRPGETVTLNPTMTPYLPGEQTLAEILKEGGGKTT